MISKNSFNLAILDLSLPDGSGYEICKIIKAKEDIPVIFLTAIDDEVNVVMGLDMGADDYSISLRRREFAMLKSVGMTPKSFNKMINYESWFYGIKGLLYGLPISFGMMYLIYRVLSGTFDVQFAVPWKSVIVTIIAVFAIVRSTMLYATSKIKKENIIDVLKTENI